MSIITESFIIPAKGFDDVIDITSKIQNIASYISENGLINIYTPSPCCSLFTIEYEPGIIQDLIKLIDNLVPLNKIYNHDNIWHDGNAYSHLKATILKNNVTLPIIDGRIKLTPNQQILLIDFDNKPSSKEIIVTITK